MPDELDGATVETLTNAQRDALVSRMKAAWNNLPSSKQKALKPLLDQGHQQFANLVQNGVHPDPAMRPLLRIKSYLTDDWDAHLDKFGQPLNQAQAQPLAEHLKPAAIEICVASDGQILGTGKYQELDPRWELVAGTVWLENLLHKHPFPHGTPKILPMANAVTIAIASDWGTGNFGPGDSPSTKIGKCMAALHPDYTIHLGDVYYAGTASEELNNFTSTWPQGAKGSFALNSNHEMYSGGGPYFNNAVGGPVFNAPGKQSQSPYSFFALENDHWIIVGLDSAYYSNVLELYLNGTLGSGNAQISFLQGIAKRGKKVIVLTHHNGLPISGDPVKDTPPQLYNDVMAAFKGHPAPEYWFYGHEHLGVAYAPLAGGTLCRCIGYGSLPWGLSTDLQAAQKAGKVQWFERCNAGDPSDNLRVYNGFITLKLDGADLTETFYDETGRVAWQPGTTDTRCP